MIRVGIRDGSFPFTASMSTDFEAPKYFAWDKSATAVPRFYTDICLKQVFGQPHPRVAILIEAPPFRTEFYEFAEKYEAEFDYILTYMRPLLEKHDPAKWLYYPHCGTRIPLEQWGVPAKTKRVSMIASNKTDATGHKLRHAIAERFEGRLDILGSIRGAYIDKYSGHAPYQYSVVIDGECNDWCFSDHIIDCMSVGTVPIYWGCPEIGKFFDPHGIISIAGLSELDDALYQMADHDYERRLPAIRRNLETAKQYRIAENWIYENYPFLFEGLA